MNHKEFFVEGYKFVLSYMDKKLLDQQVKGRVRAFLVFYKPRGLESEAQTVELLERFEEHFLREIYAVINQNPQWYERFEIYRRFDGGWSGGYNDFGRAATINADRALVMYVRE